MSTGTLTKTIDPIIEDARKHRERYYSELQFLELYKVNVGALTSITTGFITERGLNPEADLEELIEIAERSRDSVALIAESFHFARKAALKHYQHGNPLPLIDAAFRAVEPTEDGYAAQFFSKLCKLMTKDDEIQKTRNGDNESQRVMRPVLREILPAVVGEYDDGIAYISEYRNRNQFKYRQLKSRFVQQLQENLDKLVGYANMRINDGKLASLDDFNIYRDKGIQPSNDNGKSFVPITENLILELARRQKTYESNQDSGVKAGDYGKVLEELERKAGELLCMDYDSGNKHRGSHQFTVIAGQLEHPKRYRLDFGGETPERAVHDLFLAITDHILGKQNLPDTYRRTTRVARTKIINYFV